MCYSKLFSNVFLNVHIEVLIKWTLVYSPYVSNNYKFVALFASSFFFSKMLFNTNPKEHIILFLHAAVYIYENNSF